jgi:hypothetical protein
MFRCGSAREASGTGLELLKSWRRKRALVTAAGHNNGLELSAQGDLP